MADHRVTVTPVGPRYLFECTCGMPERRFASKSAANAHGIAHLAEDYPVATAETPEFTLDALGLHCTACRHRGDAHVLRGTGTALITCTLCGCATRHP